MTSPRRGFLLLPCALLLMACGAGPATESVAPTEAGATASPEGVVPTPVPGSTQPSDAVLQTDTGWGRIWDAIPVTFPRYPDAIPTQTREGPVSASFAVGASAEQAATFMQAALETAGFSTEAMSGPLEDGSIVIDSVGDPLTCRVQTRLTPLSGTTHMTVLYGAACPFE